MPYTADNLLSYTNTDWQLQGLFVPFAHIGSGDPVRVLRLFHNKYTGYNWSIYCWYYVQPVATDASVLLLKSVDSETSYLDRGWSSFVPILPVQYPNGKSFRTVLYGALNSCSCGR